MTCKRFNHRSAVLGGKIYAVGGWGGEKLNSVESFSPKSGRWESTAPLVTAREGCAVAAVNSRLIYAIGGEHIAGKCLSSVERYDPATDRWESVAKMSSVRAFTTAVAAS
eukprot:g32858.t1